RAVHRIGEHVLVNGWLWGIALASAGAAMLGVSFWITLPAAGVVYVLLGRRRTVTAALVLAAAVVVALLTAGEARPEATGAAASGAVGALPLFLSGLKAGLLTFGGAYTAIPFVRDDAVGRGWVSDGQFLDGLALSGIIPAPLIIFATFVGFQAGGLGGALAMTAGIFLPAFAFSLLFFERLERVVEDDRLHGVLEGIAAGVVGLIAATLLELAWSVARSVPALPVALLIFAASLALLYAWKSKYNVLGVIGLSAVVGAIALRGAG
ncbi:MAG TPA: chromate efflux transporter, partial [Sphingomicrobium sp.]